MENTNYISKAELSQSLGISLSTLNRKMHEIPHFKLGDARKSRVMFDPEKIKDYLKQFEVNGGTD
tara:strand:+ start:198 stop:392 length:195 start_codon:yes stop_codon:yes gene_type:complete